MNDKLLFTNWIQYCLCLCHTCMFHKTNFPYPISIAVLYRIKINEPNILTEPQCDAGNMQHSGHLT